MSEHEWTTDSHDQGSPESSITPNDPGANPEHPDEPHVRPEALVEAPPLFAKPPGNFGGFSMRKFGRKKTEAVKPLVFVESITASANDAESTKNEPEARWFSGIFTRERRSDTGFHWSILLLGNARRETRFGIAALLSFVVLVTAFILNRSTGHTKAPLSLALNKPVGDGAKKDPAVVVPDQDVTPPTKKPAHKKGPPPEAPEGLSEPIRTSPNASKDEIRQTSADSPPTPSEPMPASKTEPKADPKNEPKAEPAPLPKTEPKAEPKPEPKPVEPENPPPIGDPKIETVLPPVTEPDALKPLESLPAPPDTNLAEPAKTEPKAGDPLPKATEPKPIDAPVQPVEPKVETKVPEPKVEPSLPELADLPKPVETKPPEIITEPKIDPKPATPLPIQPLVTPEPVTKSNPVAPPLAPAVPVAASPAQPTPIPIPTPIPAAALTSTPPATEPLTDTNPVSPGRMPAFAKPPTTIESEQAASLTTSTPVDIPTSPSALTPIRNLGKRRPTEADLESRPSATASVADAPMPREVAGSREQVEPILHTVANGENFWTISKLYYRSGRYYKALHSVNRKLVPNISELYVGTTIKVPQVEDLDPTLIEAPRRSATGAVATSSSSESARPAPRKARTDVDPAMPTVGASRRRDRQAEDVEEATQPIYKVRAHDTLRSIARETLGDSRRYREILELNRDLIDDPTRLTTGQTLTLPDDATVGRRIR